MIMETEFFYFGGDSLAKDGNKRKKLPRMPRAVGVSKYEPRYCRRLWEYFLTYEDKGIPQMTAFAREIGVDIKTLRNWRNEHEDFAAVYGACMDIQQEILTNGGLTGELNPRMVQFVLSANHKVREYARLKAEDKTVDVEMTSEDRRLMQVVEQRLVHGREEAPVECGDMLNVGAVPAEEEDGEE